MNTTHGFHAQMTARPGKADELIDLLLSGPVSGPSASADCTIFLVSRSATNPDLIHLVEGWTTEAAHRTVFDSEQGKAYVARFGDLVADSQYADFVAVGGKAALTTSDDSAGQ